LDCSSHYYLDSLGKFDEVATHENNCTYSDVMVSFIFWIWLKRNTGNKSNEADALASQEIGRDYMVHIHKKGILTMNIYSVGYLNSYLNTTMFHLSIHPECMPITIVQQPIQV
jgi:hypothetical protein